MDFEPIPPVPPGMLKMNKNVMTLDVKRVIKGALIFALILIFLNVFYIVPAGHRGVLLTFGKPTMNAMPEGIGFKIPIAQKVVKMSVQTMKYEADANSASHDLQIVHTRIAVNYHLDSESVPKIYQSLGLTYESRVIQPIVQEVVKAATALFTAEELITKRPEVKSTIQDEMQARLSPRGIIVEEISMTDFDFSRSFNDAIEAKVTAEQLKFKAEMDLERIIIEKDQKITQAEAEAESLRIQKQEVTLELIQLRAIEKWDGHLPKVTGGAIPFIDVLEVADK